MEKFVKLLKFFPLSYTLTHFLFLSLAYSKHGQGCKNLLNEKYQYIGSSYSYSTKDDIISYYTEKLKESSLNFDEFCKEEKDDLIQLLNDASYFSYFKNTYLYIGTTTSCSHFLYEFCTSSSNLTINHKSKDVESVRKEENINNDSLVKENSVSISSIKKNYNEFIHYLTENQQYHRNEARKNYITYNYDQVVKTQGWKLYISAPIDTSVELMIQKLKDLTHELRIKGIPHQVFNHYQDIKKQPNYAIEVFSNDDDEAKKNLEQIHQILDDLKYATGPSQVNPDSLNIKLKFLDPNQLIGTRYGKIKVLSDEIKKSKEKLPIIHRYAQYLNHHKTEFKKISTARYLKLLDNNNQLINVWIKEDTSSINPKFIKNCPFLN